jgi:choline dehydrogenase
MMFRRDRRAVPDPDSVWDYIIIGAGAAGCVLADRLSASGRNNVLLVEMGSRVDGFLKSRLIRMPKGFRKTLHDPRLTSTFITEPEGRAQRKFVWIRGKGLGGSTAVNGMIYVRGHPEDYDNWERAGCAGWGWREIERCFRQIEDHELGDDGVRGSGGPLPISIQNRPTALTEAVIAAGEAIGLPRLEDLNSHDPEGTGYSPCNIRNGERVSAAAAFLMPAMHRPNLAVVTDTLVERILFDGQRATGILCRQPGRTVHYRASGEVIVAAGALDTPRLLQLSGVGAASLLSDIGIPVVHNSPAVGANMRDHKPVRMQYRLKHPHLSYNDQFSGWRLAMNVVRYLIWRDGLLATTYDLCALARSRDDVSRPDFQMIISAYSVVPGKEPVTFESEPGASVHLFPVRPESLGSINVRSADPSVPPIVKANYLGTENDRRVTVDSVRFVRRLFAQAALQSYIAGEFDPGSNVTTDDEILAACEMSGPSAHATGTCQMGIADADVVDPKLRVRGVSGLRVADASIFPTMVSGNTMGPVLAAAWRASEIILADQRLGSSGR